MPEAQRQTFLSGLTNREAEALVYDWPFWARPDQLPPAGDWSIWLLKAGRGAGKTRTGAETVRWAVKINYTEFFTLVARTAADARDVMVEGPAGIMAVFPPTERPVYEPSKRRITFQNGAIATLRSADEPDGLRGPQSGMAWCDELAAWRYPEAWDMLMMGNRLGVHPITVVSTTPKPTPLFKTVRADPATAISEASSYANFANLAPSFIAFIKRKYEGTRLGLQELLAQELEDTPGALWTRGTIEAGRVTDLPKLVRVVVAVDPPGSSGEEAAECGIIGVGIDSAGDPYILDDASMRGTPAEWGKAAVALFHKLRADKIVGEVNNGGEMVEHVIRTVEGGRLVPYRAVRASRGKAVRAEPVSALYEQGRAHHVGYLAELEDQMTTWVPGIGDSPDRVDALVWAIYDLVPDLTDEKESTAFSFEAANLYETRSSRRR